MEVVIITRQRDLSKGAINIQAENKLDNYYMNFIRKYFIYHFKKAEAS